MDPSYVFMFQKSKKRSGKEEFNKTIPNKKHKQHQKTINN